MDASLTPVSVLVCLHPPRTLHTVTATPDATNPLSRCEALNELEASVLGLLLERCRTVDFEADEILIHQGAPGDSLLILLEGEAAATVETPEGRRSAVGDFGPYDIIGEMAILTGEPRTAEVAARSAGQALVLMSADLHDLVAQYPEIGVLLTHMVADRLGGKSADGLGSKVVDRYRIDRCIGRGSMAIVYEARELETNRRVALKMMSHRLIYEKGAKARFQREADILAGLEHENVTRIFRRFSAYRTCFIAMEFCDGCDLAALFSDGHSLPEEELRKVVGQLAAGLAYLHARDVVHRDLKPQNVLVWRGGRVGLADFGLARASAEPLQGGLTMPGTLLGTPYYMAPEMLVGADASPASDLYALGCVAYELVTGDPPFRGETLYELATKRREATLPPRREVGPGISPELHAFLVACLAPDPAQRRVDLAEIGRWSAPLATAGLSFD